MGLMEGQVIGNAALTVFVIVVVFAVVFLALVDVWDGRDRRKADEWKRQWHRDKENDRAD